MVGQEAGGGGAVVGCVKGDDRNLAAVKRALADAADVLDVLERLTPEASLGQRARPVGDEHCPQPPDDLAVVGGGHGQGAEIDDKAVDLRGRLVPDGSEQRADEVMGGEAVAVSCAEPPEIDEGLQRELRGRGAERPCAMPDPELLLAQVAGEGGQAAVACDQRAEAAGLGRRPRGLGRGSGRGVREAGELPDAHVQPVAGGPGAGHEREAAGRALPRCGDHLVTS
jgi:hypothetical protein